MRIIPWMWSVWGALFLVFIAFKVYVSRLSRNEDDQLILQDSSGHVRAEQEAILARLEKTKPVGIAILALFGLMTIYVAGYYILDMLRQFKQTNSAKPVENRARRTQAWCAGPSLPYGAVSDSAKRRICGPALCSLRNRLPGSTGRS